MVKIVGVRFRSAGKVYYFDPKEYSMHPGDHVIVETSRGIEYGTVTGSIQEISEDKVVLPLRAVLRMASPEDIERVAQDREREREALKVCREKVRKHNLDMKVIDAEYTFDGTKLLFYFTADGRVDFRELVKDLASVFRTRIELRQIGVRDETKILGGVGVCGRPLCCHTFLSDFAPVTIRMAKEQNLSLNPVKISGVCGRLMCCLKNEEETYEYLNSQLPANGDTVTTPSGEQGVVTGVNILRQKVKVLFEDGDTKTVEEYDAAELKFKPRRRKGDKGRQDKAKGEGEKAGSGEEQQPKERKRDRKKNHERSEEGREGREAREGKENRTGKENREGGHSREKGGREKEGAQGRDKEKRERRGEGAQNEQEGQEPREHRRRETRGERRRRKAAEAAAKAQQEGTPEEIAAAQVDEEIAELGGFEKLHEKGDLQSPEEIGELEELEILEQEETGSALRDDE